MKNKILIPIIVILVLGGGFFIWHQYLRPVEEVQVPPVEEEIPNFGLLEERVEALEQIKITEENKEEKLNEIYPRFLAMEACQGISQAKTSEKIVALTFDDGPNKEYTQEILSILENYNIKATFFINGKYAKTDPELVKEIFEKGHIIGNHSFSHSNFIHFSEQEIREEIKRTSEIIYEIIGERPTFFRPPFGACSPLMVEILREKDYQIITWSAMTNDWDPVNAEHIAQDILRRVAPGGIIGLHDGGHRWMGEDRSQTVKAVLQIIEELQNRGYCFVPLSDLLNISAYREVDVKQNETLNIVEKIFDWGHHIPLIPRSIDTIIIHSSYDALGDNPHSVEGMIDVYRIYGVANHYLIARNGIIHRLVLDENIAYHAGVSKMPDNRTNVNTFSIGITLIYQKTEKPNEIQYQSLANLVKYLREKYNIPIVNILGHTDISPDRKTDPWNFDWQKFNEMLK